MRFADLPPGIAVVFTIQIEERALGLEDGIIVFKGSLGFYLVVIRQVTIACGFFFWLQNK